MLDLVILEVLATQRLQVQSPAGLAAIGASMAFVALFAVLGWLSEQRQNKRTLRAHLDYQQMVLAQEEEDEVRCRELWDRYEQERIDAEIEGWADLLYEANQPPCEKERA